MVEGSLQFPAALIEFPELHLGEVIKVLAVASHEMREHAAGDDGILMLQSVDDFIQVFFRVKAQTVHTCIQFDVYRIARDTFLLCSMYQCIHQTEIIHFRFQVILKHGLEGSHLRIHNHDITGDAVLTQGHTLVSHSHSQIVHAMILQGLCHLHSTGTVSICLHHAHQFGLRFHK